MLENRHIIAKNTAKLIHDGDFINLGVGMPTLVGMYFPEDITVWLHAENGVLGQHKILGSCFRDDYDWLVEHIGSKGDWKEGHIDLVNASGEYISLLPGSSCFDSCVSFAMARGGHLDATILGGLQVDQEGNLANWTVPGQSMKGMGGAMDLVSGAKRVIITMEHCSKTGEPKLVKKCTMPLTALHCVSVVVTEKCIVEFKDGKPVVTAMAPGLTKEELIACTEAELTFADTIAEMEVE